MPTTSWFEQDTIQAIDTDDETLYILRRPGQEPVTAYWPHPLEELCPTAIRIPAYTDARAAYAVFTRSPEISTVVGGNRSGVSSRLTTKAEREERRRLKQREERLKAWRRLRPRRFLRTGRSHNKSARLSEADIRAIQWRHYVGYESLRSICRELWQEKGYASDKSMLNTVCDTLSAYGLKKRGRAEMTAHTNRLRSMRLEGETKNQFKRRRRREKGEAHGRVCLAIKTRYGQGRGARCKRPALDDGDYCRQHDPRYAEANAEILEKARASRAA